MSGRIKITVALLSALVGGCAVTPEPFESADVETFAKSDMSLIYDSQEPLGAHLSLSEAMARALKYNLDNRVKLVEQAVANGSFELAKLDTLPMLTASLGYSHRTNENASSSESVITRRESLEPSTSQESDRRVADIRFTWNLLDYGVSSLQAKQDANRYLISQKARQKVMLKLLQQVRSAYWRAAAMQQMAGQADQMLARVDQSLRDLEQTRREQLKAPLVVLNDIRSLLETRQQLKQIRHSVNLAQMELATLINVPPGTPLRLDVPQEFKQLPSVPADIESMELMALTNSADYINQAYNVRIDQLETRKALMRIIPGIEFSYGRNYDSNRYLWNNQWGEAGIKLSGDLTRLFFMDEIEEHGEANEQLALSRRLAINMAVVAGVHLSWQEYQNALGRLQEAEELNSVDQDIARLTQNALSSQAASGVEAIQNEFRAFRSAMGQLLSYAEAQEAYGAFLVSLGVNPVPDEYQLIPVPALAEQLQGQFGRWQEQGLRAPQADSAGSPQDNKVISADQQMAARRP